MGYKSNKLWHSSWDFLYNSDYYNSGKVKKIEDFTTADIAESIMELHNKCRDLTTECRSYRSKVQKYDKVVADNAELRQKLYQGNKEYIQEEVEKRFRRSNSNIVNEIESKLASKYKKQILEKDDKISILEAENKNLKDEVKEWKSKFMAQASANTTLLEMLSNRQG